jgi:hypothetical protein
MPVGMIGMTKRTGQEGVDAELREDAADRPERAAGE